MYIISHYTMNDAQPLGPKMKIAIALLLLLFVSSTFADEVKYDGRALIINGQRKIIFSGSIHYPRSTPEMWPVLIAKAKEGGIDVIQTYVFWNVHEPIQGQFNFQGRNDIVRFIKTVQDQGLYVSLRIGPFIESEWKYGGLPFWLHDVPGIVFRSENQPFKFQMQKWVTTIVNLMKSERLYASQGGPIIISQIENEYEMVEPAFHEQGPPYVRWAASMAVNQQIGVPWMMCKQQDAPDPVINTCNGLYCGETFKGPNSPNKPALWTENWISQFQVFGGNQYRRSAEDIAFAVVLFIAAKHGSFVNYYMYHGGTNFGRYGSAYVTTSYYDDAPLDEYGLIKNAKWGHLKELHSVIKASSNPLLFGSYLSYQLGNHLMAYVFKGRQNCVAFLLNNDVVHDATVQFQKRTYQLAKRSISILPDCKNEAFNTAKVRAKYGKRSAKPIQYINNLNKWKAFWDGIPNFDQASYKAKGLLEQLSTTKDNTDYLWYTVSYDSYSYESNLKLSVTSKAHVIHAFVNGVYTGNAHGSHVIHEERDPNLEVQITLNKGKNTISLLSVMVGSPDNGAYLERRVQGLRSVKITGFNKQTVDLSYRIWGYQVGLNGEKAKIYSGKGLDENKWRAIDGFSNKPLVWYKAIFDATFGNNPVALNLASMGKGEAWINGESIGRYWVSFKTKSGLPSQSLYHVPRSFLKPSGNLLVLFEEMGGNPLGITVNTVSVE